MDTVNALVTTLQVMKFMHYLLQNLYKLFYIHVHVDAMAENNRLTKAPSVIKAYGTIMSAYRGEVSCTVTSAKVCAFVLSICGLFMCLS